MKIDIIKYDRNRGIQLNWERNFSIHVICKENEVSIMANNEGLISLAKHFLTLAQEDVPMGTHIHLDQFNSLEDGSVDLIIEKIEN